MMARRAFVPLLIGAVVALACGSLDQPLWNGHVLADGVAPYRKVADLEFCVGSAKFVAVAPANGDQGLCRPSGAAPKSCTVDDECADRENCVCGRCTVKICADSKECKAGRKCTGFPSRCAVECVTDAECSGGRCNAGACGPLCASDAECAQGEQCLSGRCVVVSCGPLAGCQGATTCDPQLQAGVLHAPAALIRDGRTVLYVETFDTAVFASTIIRAESTDGTHFNAVPTAPVIPTPADGSRVAAPAVLETATGIDLYYEVLTGGGIHRMHSTDGQTFGGDELVLAPNLDDWEAGSVGSPGVLAVPGAVLLYYVGGAGAGIGLARSEDRGPFTRVGSQPLLTPALATQSVWTDLDAVGGPAPVAYTDPFGVRSVRLFFSGHGRELTEPKDDGGPGPLNYSIGLAVAPEATPQQLRLAAYNPVLSGIFNLHSQSEDEPSVVRVGDEWRMFCELKLIPEVFVANVEQPVGLAFATNPPRGAGGP